MGSPTVEQSAAATVITVPIQEGSPAAVSAVRFPGATLPEDELRRAAGLEPGAPVDATALLAATDRLRAHYFERGYAAVRLNPALQPQGESLDVVFQVAEGPRRTVGQVVIRGLKRTRESLVRRQLRLRPGRPVDPRDLVAVERRLLDLGVFARATVEASDEDPSTITVSVEEGDRLVAGYDLRRDDETGNRAELDGEVRNLLGVGLVLGARYGVGRDVRDTRLALSLPAVRKLGRLTVSAFRLDEDLPADEGSEDVEQNVRRRSGGQFQLTRRLFRSWDLLLGYRFKRTLVLPVFPDPLDIAAVDVSLLRDTRDSTLDARRGRFWSVSVEYSPEALGSDFTFVKGYGQVFAMRPIARFAHVGARATAGPRPRLRGTAADLDRALLRRWREHHPRVRHRHGRPPQRLRRSRGRPGGGDPQRGIAVPPSIGLLAAWRSMTGETSSRTCPT